jgi:methionyl-tRNA synthetase
LTLENISISRSNLQWGVRLPFDPEQTAYVWVDALLNYITAIGYGEDSDQYKKLWPADLHLMAKDILWFHSVIWPAMLLALELPLPHKIFAHGFFTINGDKMSKTLGNVIVPKEMTAKFGVDASRYLLLSLFPFGADGDISWKGLTDKYNTDLANNLGNLLNRTLDMLDKFSASKIPFRTDDDSLPIETTNNILSKLSPNYKLLDELDFSSCICNIQSAIDMANRYIQEKAPWKLAKEQSPQLNTVLYTLIANLKMITVFVTPFMPQISETIWEQIGETDPIENFIHSLYSKWNKYMLEPHRSIYPISGTDLPKSGNAIKKGGILFPRIVEKK